MVSHNNFPHLVGKLRLFDFSRLSQRIEGAVTFEVRDYSIEVVGYSDRYILKILGLLNHIGASFVTSETFPGWNAYSFSAGKNKVRVGSESTVHLRVSCQFGIRVRAAHLVAESADQVREVHRRVIADPVRTVAGLAIADWALVCSCTARALHAIQWAMLPIGSRNATSTVESITGPQVSLYLVL